MFLNLLTRVVLPNYVPSLFYVFSTQGGTILTYCFGF